MDYRAVFGAIHTDLKARFPKFKIAFKDESIIMKLVGKILFFNPAFMTDYVTTIGHTVYFPGFSPDIYEEWDTLAHEGVHVADYHEKPLRFTLGYIFPQCLASLALLTLLAIWFSPWFLLCLGFLAALAPWPAPFRAHSERRGYMMTMVCNAVSGGSNWVKGSMYRDWMARHYTGWDYYRMSWDKDAIAKMVLIDAEYACGLAEGRYYDPLYSPTVKIIETSSGLTLVN